MGSFRLRIPAVALCLALPIFSTAAAGSEAAGGWTSRGPFCARPSGLAGGSGLAYLAVGGKLFRSRDGWVTWSRVGAELPAAYVSAVAAASQTPQLVYWAIGGVGIFRSRDGGESWSSVFRGLPDLYIDDLVVPASPAGTVFAIARYSGIYRSKDRGETWTDVSPPEGPTNYFALLSHPLVPKRLAAQTYRGIWRSNDGGDTWKLWTAGLPAEITNGAGGSGGLTLAPGDQDTAFATVYQTLYISQRGQAWKKIGWIPVNSFAYVNTLVAGPGETPVLLAGQDGNTTTAPGILRSRDGGKTWKPLSFLGETVYRLSYLPAIGRFIALTGRGAVQSKDFGNTWKRIGDGVVASRVLSIAVAGSADTILVAGLEACPGGLARSADGGKTWSIQEIRSPGLSYGAMSTDVDTLAAAPSRPSRVYAGEGDEILRSDNGGSTWTHFRFRDGLSGGHSAAIVVHPTDPNLLFVAGQHGLSRSLDGARTWSGGLHEDPYDFMTAVAFEPGRPQRMLAASWDGGLTRSVDTGATWTPIPGTDTLRIGVLAFNPHGANVVLASDLFAEATLYRSVDGGSTWAQSGVGLEGVIRGLTFAADGAEAVAAGSKGVFLSTDSGQTWQKVEGGPAVARAIVLRKNGILHVGTEAGVVSSQGALRQ